MWSSTDWIIQILEAIDHNEVKPEMKLGVGVVREDGPIECREECPSYLVLTSLNLEMIDKDVRGWHDTPYQSSSDRPFGIIAVKVLLKWYNETLFLVKVVDFDHL